MSETDVHCLVCDTPTDLACTACSQQYYCSEECQKEDWKYHQKECQNAPIEGAIWGFGMWKKTLNNHAWLLMKMNSEIAQGEVTADTIRRLDDNPDQWASGRTWTSFGRLLVILARKFNASLQQYALSRKNNDRASMSHYGPAALKNAESLAIVFSRKASPGGVRFPPDRNYLLGFEAYAKCIMDHSGAAVELDALRRDPDLHKPLLGGYEELKKKYEEAEKRKEEQCYRIARALGSVLNGRRWIDPL